MGKVRIDGTAVIVGVALLIGSALRWRLGWPGTDPVLVLIAVRQPLLYRALYVAYTTLLFTTPYLVCSVVGSLAYIFLGHLHRPAPAGALPPYPAPGTREDLFVILGEQHHPTRSVPLATPRWLTIPERGLFTGIAVIGAVGSGKTSGCLYPYAERVLGSGAQDPAKRIGGLVLEAKGDFCHDVRRMLSAHGRADDYVEISLDGPWRHNPLHNDLDAYAQAYGIASLLNNVFGKGKKPFWQQAYTNLAKVLTLLHRMANDDVTLFDVYVCAINPDQLADVIVRAEPRVHAGKTQILVAAESFHRLGDSSRGTFLDIPDVDDVAARESPTLSGCLEQAGAADRKRVVPAPGDDVRREQLDRASRDGAYADVQPAGSRPQDRAPAGERHLRGTTHLGCAVAGWLTRGRRDATVPSAWHRADHPEVPARVLHAGGTGDSGHRVHEHGGCAPRGYRAAPHHPDQRGHGHRKDDAAQCPRRAAAARRTRRGGRGDGRTPDHGTECRAIGRAPRTARAFGHDHAGLTPRDVAASSRSDSGGEGARWGSLRSPSGAQQWPRGGVVHHPRECSRAGVVAPDLVCAASGRGCVVCGGAPPDWGSRAGGGPPARTGGHRRVEDLLHVCRYSPDDDRSDVAAPGSEPSAGRQ